MPNPSFEPKTHRWRAGVGAPSWEVPSQNCTFCTLKQPFLAQIGREIQSKTDKRRETVHTLHVRLDCPMTISPFLPSNSTICPRNGPKMAKSGRDCAHFVSTSPEINNGLYLGPRGSKSNSQGMESTCKPPLFVVSKPQNRPTRPLDPHTSGHLLEPEGSPGRTRWGPPVGPSGSPGRKKHFFQSCSSTIWDANKCF